MALINESKPLQKLDETLQDETKNPIAYKILDNERMPKVTLEVNKKGVEGTSPTQSGTKIRDSYDTNDSPDTNYRNPFVKNTID